MSSDLSGGGVGVCISFAPPCQPILWISDLPAPTAQSQPLTVNLSAHTHAWLQAKPGQFRLAFLPQGSEYKQKGRGKVSGQLPGTQGAPLLHMGGTDTGP